MHAKMKATSSYGILKTIYHNGYNGSYLLFFEKENYNDLKFHGNNSSYFEISASLF